MRLSDCQSNYSLEAEISKRLEAEEYETLVMPTRIWDAWNDGKVDTLSREEESYIEGITEEYYLLDADVLNGEAWVIAFRWND